MNWQGGQGLDWSSMQLRRPHDSSLDFIKKAAVVVDTFAPGGQLLPQQMMSFVKLSIIQSRLLQMCNTTIIPTSQYEIDKIGFTGQVLNADEENIAFSQADLATPETGKVSYNSKRYKAELGISYDTLKRQIEGNNLVPYLTGELATAVTRDIEFTAINGDTSLPPTTRRNRLLRLQDGFLKRISANVIDAEGARLSLDLFDDAQRAMPKEYRYQKDMSYLVSANGPIEYKGLIRSRATQLGDATFNTLNLPAYDGTYPVVGIPLFPDTLTYAGEDVHTNMLYTSPSEQLLIGYLEEMSIRVAEDIRQGKFIVVMRVDVAFQVKHNEANVKVSNIRDVR